MTLAKAEQITGYEIRLLHESRFGVCYGAFWAEVEIAKASASKPGQALKLLVEKVYKLHSAIVIKAQRYRCADCGKRLALTAHHIKFRSHGRTDAVENLVGLCSACHDIRHGRKHG